MSIEVYGGMGNMLWVNGISNGVVNLILFGLVVGIRKTFTSEGLRAFLLHIDKRGRGLFLRGLAVGLVTFMLYPLLLTVIGQGKFYFSFSSISNTLIVVLSSGFGFLGVALFEEGLIRGYILQKLLKRFSVQVSISISSLLFGLPHFMNYSASKFFWLGLFNATVIGVILAIIVIRTQSLMMAVGYHLAWNLTQELLFLTYSDKCEALINVKVLNNIFTGTPNVPEASITVTIILVLLLVYTLIRFRKQDVRQVLNT